MKDRYSCGGCGVTWTALNAAHCSACHRLFSTTRLFDLHRSTSGGEHGSCRDPLTYRSPRTGRPLPMEYRDGMFRGPEMTDVARAARAAS